jgi:hypothetical protein
MRPALRLPARALSIVLLGSACQGGSSEADATDEGNTHGSAGTDSATGGASPHEVCDRYLTCVAAAAPGSLPVAQMGFGENGTCWQGSEQESQLCLDACEAGLKMYNEIAPDEEKCALCKEHSECDMAAGELCHLGHCEVTTCGDGIVDAMEVCDSQPDCAPDCQDPLRCNPVSGYGCSAYACTINRKYASMTVTSPQCLDHTNLKETEPCGETVSELCEVGLACASPDLVHTCDSEGKDGCCTRLCVLEAPTQCKASETCVPFVDPNGLQLPAEFSYVGFCVVS